MFSSFNIPLYISGAILSVLLGLIIIGGITRIAKVTEKLVPFMAIIYFLGSLSVIIYNYDNIIPSFGILFNNVLNGSSAAGGFLGASVSLAFNSRC